MVAKNKIKMHKMYKLKEKVFSYFKLFSNITHYVKASKLRYLPLSTILKD